MSVTSFFRRVRDVPLFNSKPMVGLAVGVVALGVAHAHAQTFEYDANGLPYTYSTNDLSTADAEFRRSYTFDVTDDFDVAQMSFSFSAFLNDIGNSDLILISPQGTEVWLTDWSCRNHPVLFGSRDYEAGTPGVNSVTNGVVTNAPRALLGPGAPETYIFEDTGASLGSTGGGTSDLLPPSERGACWQAWESVPDWPGAASDGVSQSWTRIGAYKALPPAPATYAPSRGSLADFKGESALGTWTLRIDNYGGGYL